MYESYAQVSIIYTDFEKSNNYKIAVAPQKNPQSLITTLMFKCHFEDHIPAARVDSFSDPFFKEKFLNI